MQTSKIKMLFAVKGALMTNSDETKTVSLNFNLI